MRIQIIAPEGAKYIGFAKIHLAVLDKMRQDAGLDRMQKYYRIDDFLIFVCSDALNPLIRITGGRSVGQILIGNDELVYVYDYIKNTLSKVPTNVGGSALVPIYNGRCQNEGLSQITYDTKWSSSVLGDSLEYVGGLNAYEAAFFLDEDTLSARIGADLGTVATIPDLLLPFYGATGSMFCAMSYKNDIPWNLYQGGIAYGLNLSTKTLLDTWYWVPSFFTVQPADTYGLKPGWYYGQYPNPDYDVDNALTSLKVSFKGLVDSRYTEGPYTYGWCELVTEVDGADKNDLNFFFQETPLTSQGNASAYRELVTGSYDLAKITIGSDLPGFERSLSITPDIVNPDVSMWSFAGWTEGEDPAGAVGIALTKGAFADFYRFKGYSTQVYSTDSYHSHSVSRNGSILAVFESDDGDIIQRVKVFDLFGVKDGKVYISGGFTELQASAKVEAVEAVSACLIPYRQKEFKPLELGYTLADSTPGIFEGGDYTNYLPSLSTLSFVKDATQGLTLQKVVCENGVDAEFGISFDPCFESTIVVDDPDKHTDADRLVSSWDVEGNLRGLVRGAFNGQHPNMRFDGIGDGDAPLYGTMTLNPTLTIIPFEDGAYEVRGVSGDVTTTCLTEDMELDPACQPDCGGIVEITASSSCGQSGSLDVDVGVPALEVSGPSPTYVDAVYSASGGKAPYVWSISAGLISEAGVITSLAGACGAGTVTVTDACGSQATLDVRFPTGQWVKISYVIRSSFYDGSESSLDNFCGNCTKDRRWSGRTTTPDVTLIVGSMKYREKSVTKWAEDFTGGVMLPIAIPKASWPSDRTVVCSSIPHSDPCYMKVSPTANVPLVNERWTYEWQCP